MNNTTAKVQALEYLSRGISVIPVPHKTKKAVIPWKEFQNRLPTEEEVDAWFFGPGETNLAIVCGQVSGGIVVLDFDSAELFEKFFPTDEARAKLKNSTLVVQTGIKEDGKRGFHVYYKVQNPPQKLNLGESKSVPFDLLSNGCVVLAPGSTHETGVQYEQISTVPTIQEVPDAFIEQVFTRLEEITGKTIKEKEPVSFKELEKGLSQGGRNAGALKFFSFYRKAEKTKEEARTAGLEWNKHNKPPLPERELNSVLESAFKDDGFNFNFVENPLTFFGPEKRSKRSRSQVNTEFKKQAELAVIAFDGQGRELQTVSLTSAGVVLEKTRYFKGEDGSTYSTVKNYWLSTVRPVFKTAYIADDAGDGEKTVFEFEVENESGKTSVKGTLEEVLEFFKKENFAGLQTDIFNAALKTYALKQIAGKRLERIRVGRAVGVFRDNKDNLFLSGVDTPTRLLNLDIKDREERVLSNLQNADKCGKTTKDGLDALRDLFPLYCVPKNKQKEGMLDTSENDLSATQAYAQVVGAHLFAPFNFVLKESGFSAGFLVEGARLTGKSTLSRSLTSIFGGHALDDELTPLNVNRNYAFERASAGGLPRTLSEVQDLTPQMVNALVAAATSKRGDEKGNAKLTKGVSYANIAALLLNGNFSDPMARDAQGRFGSRYLSILIPPSADWKNYQLENEKKEDAEERYTQKLAVFRTVIDRLENNYAFGLAVLRKLLEKYPTYKALWTRVSETRREVLKALPTQEERNAQAYAQIFLGLEVLAELYKQNGAPQPDVIAFFETPEKNEFGKELTPVQSFLKWVKGAEEDRPVLGFGQQLLDFLHSEVERVRQFYNSREDYSNQPRELQEYRAGILGFKVFNETDLQERVIFSQKFLDRFKETKRLNFQPTTRNVLNEIRATLRNSGQPNDALRVGFQVNTQTGKPEPKTICDAFNNGLKQSVRGVIIPVEILQKFAGVEYKP